jgi:hypothetical protein
MTPFQQLPHSVSPKDPDARLPVSGDDASDGLLMFVVFTAAVLISTAAVVLIALLGEWWVLGYGFAIHVIMTAIVVLTIVQVMAGRHRSIADRDALPSTSVSARRSPAGPRQDQAGARTAIGSTTGSPATAHGLRMHQRAAQGDPEPIQPTMPRVRREEGELADGRGADPVKQRELAGGPDPTLRHHRLAATRVGWQNVRWS